MATVTVREYNSADGSLVGNISTLSFGRISNGTTSPVKVIDFAFSGVSEVANVKLGLVSAGGITVNDIPENIATDGSSSNGYFGIEHSTSFDPEVARGPMIRHFAGLNNTGTSGNSYNVKIGKRNSTTSQYVYLDIEANVQTTGQKGGSYRIFFDFE